MSFFVSCWKKQSIFIFELWNVWKFQMRIKNFFFINNNHWHKTSLDVNDKNDFFSLIICYAFDISTKTFLSNVNENLILWKFETFLRRITTIDQCWNWKEFQSIVNWFCCQILIAFQSDWIFNLYLLFDLITIC